MESKPSSNRLHICFKARKCQMIAAQMEMSSCGAAYKEDALHRASSLSLSYTSFLAFSPLCTCIA